jgi:hypothetical protein
MWHDWAASCVSNGGLYSDHWPLSVDLIVDDNSGGSAQIGENTTMQEGETEAACDSRVAELEAARAGAMATALGVALVACLVVGCVLVAPRTALCVRGGEVTSRSGGTVCSHFFSSRQARYVRGDEDEVGNESTGDDEEESKQGGHIAMSPLHLHPQSSASQLYQLPQGKI